MVEMVAFIAENLIRVLIAGGGTFVIVKVLPWAKQLGIYSIVKIFVGAAEKMADTHQIDKEKKKEYVITALEQVGVVVTPIVESMIEGAVEELDLQKNKIVDAIVGE